MIIANAKEQQTLLELGKLDLAISRSSAVLKDVETNTVTDELRTKLLAASEGLLQGHANQERIQNEIKKLVSDQELVEARIVHDGKRAQQVTNEREQKAIDQELASLKVRKNSLEDAELALLDELEKAEAAVKQLTQVRTGLNLELDSAMSKQHGEALTISAQLLELNEKKSVAFAQLGEDLQVIYTRKAMRGIAVAQTLGRDCSACRLSINAVQFEAMMAEPANHLPTCPNCDALIIR